MVCCGVRHRLVVADGFPLGVDVSSTRWKDFACNQNRTVVSMQRRAVVEKVYIDAIATDAIRRRLYNMLMSAILHSKMQTQQRRYHALVTFTIITRDVQRNRRTMSTCRRRRGRIAKQPSQPTAHRASNPPFLQPHLHPSYPRYHYQPSFGVASSRASHQTPYVLV